MEFQRARRPEQVAQRRRAILDQAHAMLRERPVADISLRELSHRVGLAKSNVLRYFDSREAIFLEVLDEEWRAWLDEVGDEVAAASGEVEVATAIATTLLARPLLCELVSDMAGVLERNITVDFAREVTTRAHAHTTHLATLVRSRLPVLDEAAAHHFALVVPVLTAGLWPYATPTPAVAAVIADLGGPPAPDQVRRGLTEALVVQLIGLVARSGAS
ncbi:MAG: TetR family transcriptional regulator [Saccharothrix sp.]|nr:TetR family transcriptional regulator [Saccharothrix sp.]